MSSEINGLGKPTKIKGLENLKNVDKSIFPSMPAENKKRKEDKKEKPVVFKFPEKAKQNYLEWMEKDSKKNKRDKKEYLAVDKLENIVSENLKNLPVVSSKVASSINYALDYIRSEASGPGSKKLEELLLQHLENLNGRMEIELQEALNDQEHNQILPEPKLADGAPAISEAKEKSAKESETEKKIAVSKFLWGNLKSAIEERFGEKVYFKRFITDEVVDRFIKELGSLFYVNDEGFVKPKNTSENGLRDFRMKVGKFTKNLLKGIDESNKSRKKIEKTEKKAEEGKNGKEADIVPKSEVAAKSVEVSNKTEEERDLRRMKFLEKYPIGTRHYDEDGNILTIEGYVSALNSGDDRIEISYGKNGFAEDTKKISRVKFFEIIKIYSENTASVSANENKVNNSAKSEVETTADLAKERSEEIAEKSMEKMKEDDKKRAERRDKRSREALSSEALDAERNEIEQEFTEKETQAMKIFEDGATDFVKRLKEESNWDGYSDEDKENTIRIQAGVFLTRQFRKRNLFSVNEKEVVEQIFNKIKK